MKTEVQREHKMLKLTTRALMSERGKKTKETNAFLMFHFSEHEGTSPPTDMRTQFKVNSLFTVMSTGV